MSRMYKVIGWTDKEIMDKMIEDVSEGTYFCWSMSDHRGEIFYDPYDDDVRGGNFEFLSQVAVEGDVIFWQGSCIEGRSEYLSDVIVDPTWLDIARLFAESIRHTGDEHHIFFEGIDLVTNTRGYHSGVARAINGIDVWELCTGS